MGRKFDFGSGNRIKSLIPTDVTEEEKLEGVQSVDIKLVKANSGQPRKFFDDTKIAELSQSIKEHGIIQPLIVNKAASGKFIIIAGERRWRAAKLAKIKEVPIIVKEYADDTALQIALIENIQREDLNAIEEALAYKELKEKYNLTQEALALKIGKSRTAIANVMRLLNLDQRVQQYITEGVISEGHGKVLLALEGEEQYKVAQKIIDDDLSVRDVEGFIKAMQAQTEEKVEKEPKKANPYYKDIKDKLQDYFGTKVNINSNKNKGKIEIEYYSEEDLQRILDIINL